MAKILIACEFSGIVRDAFAARGHDAWSCDLLPCEIGGKHYTEDVRNILLAQMVNPWDLMIVFPPCTHLAVSGARARERSRTYQGIADAMAEQWG